MASPMDLLSHRGASDKAILFPHISFFYVLRAYLQCWDKQQRQIRCKEYFPVEGEPVSLTSYLWMTASYFAKLHIRNVNMKKTSSKPLIEEEEEKKKNNLCLLVVTQAKKWRRIFEQC